MARDREHLELPEWQEALPRRKRGGGRAPDRNVKKHGEKLIKEAKKLSNQLKARAVTYPHGINPKLVFKLKLHRQGNLDEEQLGQLGLKLLARDAEKAIVVFSDQPALDELQRRLSEYAGVVAGHAYAYLAAIEELVELGPEDRTGRRLSAEQFAADERTALDVELWHTGSRDECREKVEEIRTYLVGRGLRLFDSYIGGSLCIIRAEVDHATLQVLLNTDYVKEIDRRPRPTFEMLEVARIGLEQVAVEAANLDDAVGVLILDSGVMQRHPLLGPALGDAQVFPDRLRQRIVGGAEDGDTVTGGHGTAVAGVALFGDVGECIASRRFTPLVRLFSARITDDNNEYDAEELLEHQLEEAVEYFLNNYPQVKVVNISLGDERLVCSDSSYQFRLAAAVDELAYRYRDREIVFVVSAGNWIPEGINGEQILQQYPDYLVNQPGASRIIDPATAAIALTVGGLSYGSGNPLALGNQQNTDRVVGAVRGYPSPFTRTGPGFDGAIKPEVVDFAGDLRVERGRILDPACPAYAGLPTTNKSFAPPNGSLFRTVSGTSFAAPRVAHIAARIFEEFPNASSNLVRALVAAGSKLPADRPQQFGTKKPWDAEVLNVYGYGQPNLENSLRSANNDVLLVHDGIMEIDTFKLFEIPPLPPEFLTIRGTGYLSCVLAFDPPTRHTRADSYLGATMEFALFRNVGAQQIAEALRVWDRDEREDLENDNEDVPALGQLGAQAGAPVKVDLKPGVQRRKKGTLQRGYCQIARANWQYDGEPLILAVVCQRKWAPADTVSQRFAIVASVSHDDPEIDLHAHLQQRAQVHERVRIRI